MIGRTGVPNRVIPSEPGATFTLDDGSVVAVIHAPLWANGDGPPRWLVMPGTYAPRTAQAMHHGATEGGELVAVLVSGPQAKPYVSPAVHLCALDHAKPTWTPPLGCKVVDTRVEPYKSCTNPICFTFDWETCKERGPAYFNAGDEWVDRSQYRAGWGLYDAIVPVTWQPINADVKRLEGASNFMLGATMAMLWRGALRLSKGHVGLDGSKVWGEAPMHGAPWTAAEGAVAIHNLMRHRGGAAYAALERFLYTSGRIGLGAPYLNRDDVKLVAEVIRREAEAL